MKGKTCKKRNFTAGVRVEASEKISNYLKGGLLSLFFFSKI